MRGKKKKKKCRTKPAGTEATKGRVKKKVRVVIIDPDTSCREENSN